MIDQSKKFQEGHAQMEW